MQKLDPKKDGGSVDIVAENVERLREVFPGVFAEGKVDFDALRETLGDYVEDKQERYSFTWHGKSRARRIAQTPSTGTLLPCPEESVDWDTTQNVFIEGDNLEVLKLLQKSYHRRVKMIYIDPPYNTGNELIYPDKYQDNLDTYLRYTGQKGDDGFKISTNIEGAGRYHTNWLNMMYPRLKLARNLLREDGLIFVSIDDHEVHNLRHLMEEIFGPENFLCQVCVISNPRGRQSEIVATTHEYLLVYARDLAHTTIAGEHLSVSQLADYKHSTPDGQKYRLRGLRHRGNASRRVDRPNMFFPIYVDPETRQVALERSSRFHVEVFPRKSSGEDGRWEWGSETVASRLDRLEAVLVSGRDEWDVHQREFLQSESGESRRTKWKSVWDEKAINYQNGTTELKKLFSASPFDYPKPTHLLRKIIEGTTSEDDLVLDFFAGSGTTAHACFLQGASENIRRRFILVQLPEPVEGREFTNLAEVCRARIRIASEHLKQDVEGTLLSDERGGSPADLGFRAFRLSSSNIKTWDATFDTLDQALLNTVENIRPDRSEEDVLYELLLKYGMQLASGSESRMVGGKKVYILGAGALVVCLATSVTLNVVEGIAALKAELKPEVMRVVFRDAGFADDVVKANAVQILKRAGIEDVKSL